ncbi:MAG TPA: aminoacyl-tRNA hydrolase [Candidatus Marinimicrobia bacterium]|nr:aminoacyl-tRNA hydrolase [Candidatus Neomarinimicrobiota bacterium]
MIAGFFTRRPLAATINVQKVIMGLGNPGKQYEKTRHNFGFMVVDQLADKKQLSCCSSGKPYVWSETDIASVGVCLCKPLTYMNNSGVAARDILHSYSLTPEDLLVIYDDIDLPLGKVRLRKRGSSGGHRGIQSIIDQLESREFPRLRLGIGPQDEGVAAEDYVLDNFRKAELPIAKNVIDTAIKVAEDFLSCDIEHIMNRYNRQDLTELSKGEAS